MAKEKKLLFSVTASDCRWDYYKGTGSGGQKKNKTENCVRCTHLASRAVGKAEEGRSKQQNKIKAFERMATTEVFQKWVKAEAMRRSGELAIIEAKVDLELLKNTTVEIKGEDGKWTEAPDLKPTQQDLNNIAEDILRDAKKIFF